MPDSETRTYIDAIAKDTAKGIANGASSGGCLCGGVRYEVATHLLRDFLACHCSQCRKTSGNFVIATACPREALRIVKSETLNWYESSPGCRRGFCTHCGGNLFWDNQNRSHISLFAGALDSLPERRVLGHIFTEDQSEFLKKALETDLPKWPGPPPAL